MIGPISLEDIARLAKLVIRWPEETQPEYHDRVRSQIAQLPSTLLRRHGLSRMFVQESQPQVQADLCGYHKPLRGSIINHIFTLIGREIGPRMNLIIWGGPAASGQQIWDNHVDNVRGMQMMWVPFDLYERTFLKPHPNMTKNADEKATRLANKWYYQADKCQACVIERIVSDTKALMDLRSVLKSRQFSAWVKKHGEPELSVWMSAWCEAWSDDYNARRLPGVWTKKLNDSDKIADLLREVRKQAAVSQKKERIARKHVKRDKDQGKNQNLRNILSFFAAGGNTPNRPSDFETKQREQSIAPRSRVRQAAREEKAADNERLDEVIRTSEIEQANLFAKEIAEDQQGRNRQTSTNTVDEIYNLYQNTISTPYLPGMTEEEHESQLDRLFHMTAEEAANRKSTTITEKDRNSRLSHRFSQLDPEQAAHRHSEYVEPSAEKTNTGTHTRTRAPSNYSASVYSQPTNISARAPTKVNDDDDDDRNSWYTEYVAASHVQSSEPSHSRHDHRIAKPSSTRSRNSSISRSQRGRHHRHDKDEENRHHRPMGYRPPRIDEDDDEDNEDYKPSTQTKPRLSTVPDLPYIPYPDLRRNSNSNPTKTNKDKTKAGSSMNKTKHYDPDYETIYPPASPTDPYHNHRRAQTQTAYENWAQANGTSHLVRKNKDTNATTTNTSHHQQNTNDLRRSSHGGNNNTVESGRVVRSRRPATSSSSSTTANTDRTSESRRRERGRALDRLEGVAEEHYPGYRYKRPSDEGKDKIRQVRRRS